MCVVKRIGEWMVEVNAEVFHVEHFCTQSLEMAQEITNWTS